MDDTVREDGIPVAVTVTSRVENLNAIKPQLSKRSRSRVKLPPDSSLQASVKMDHSEIYRENDYLNEDLEDYLGHINKSEYRFLAKEGGQLDEIRRQVDSITKLQEAVNSRKPGDSARLVSSARATRYGRHRDKEEKPDKDKIDFRELTKATRSQVRFELEKEKFSSKNLFNVRRSKTSLGFEPMNTRKFLPQTAMQIPPDPETDNKDSGEGLKSTPSSAKPSRPKGYLQQTQASHRGFRPVTAGHQRQPTADDILPPRAKSAVMRSRSRRELELLCRVTPDEVEQDITGTLQIDWDTVHDRRRHRRLQQIRHEDQQLQTRVHAFLTDLETFNKKPLSFKASDMREIMHKL